MIVASIDIGTNTIILLIADVSQISKVILPLYNEQKIPRIGKGLKPGRPISKDQVDELVQVLGHYNSIIKEFNCEKIIVTATNAFRIASNKNELKLLLKRQFNFDVKIVSGDEEADLTFLGAVSSINNISDSIVIDIGGGSTEVVAGNPDKIIFRNSFQFGVVTALEDYLKHSPPLQTEIISLQTKINQIFLELVTNNFKFNKAIAIAGTPTTLAAMELNLTEYDEDKLEGYILTKDNVEKFISLLSKMNKLEILNNFRSVVKGREDVILSGAFILFNLMRLLSIQEVIVSTKGIRYGAIFKSLNIK